MGSMFKPRSQKEGIGKKPEIVLVTQAPLKEKQHINLKPFRTVFYLALIGAVLYCVFFSGLFRIRSIRIEGAKSHNISNYLEQSLVGKNILLMRPSAYLRDLEKKFPILQGATIVRGLPSTVRVIVAERRQVLIWCSSIDCKEVDQNGYVYREIPRPKNRVVIVDQLNAKYSIGDKITSKEFIDIFLTALDSIEANGLKISEVQVGETTFKLSFKTQDGWLVILDPTESLKNQMSALKQVLAKNRVDIHEYVDLRVEGLAYIK